MQIGLNWNDGYEVCVLMEDKCGLRRWQPLRNFGNRQGDAKLFKYADCPLLTDTQIKMLAKRFDRSVKYERINKSKFATQQNK